MVQKGSNAGNTMIRIKPAILPFDGATIGVMLVILSFRGWTEAFSEILPPEWQNGRLDPNRSPIE